MMCTLEIARSGRLPSGVIEIPFEATIKPLLNKVLYESYHGVFINVQYLIKVVMKRNFLNRDIHKTLEFVIENKVNLYFIGQFKYLYILVLFIFQPTLDVLPSKIDKFVINQNTLANINDNSNIPKFLIIGVIDTVICSITKPFTGEVFY